MRTLLAAVAVTALAALVACAVPSAVPVANLFVGNWVTAENAAITIRPDTVIQHQSDGESTVLDQTTCRRFFRFSYGTKSSQEIAALVPRQPELKQRLSGELVEQSYPV